VPRELQRILGVFAVGVTEHGHRFAEQRAQLLARRAQLAQHLDRTQRREMRMRGGLRAELDPRFLHVADVARVEQRLLDLVCVPQVCGTRESAASCEHMITPAPSSHRSRTVISRVALARSPPGPCTTISMRYCPGERPERSTARARLATDPRCSGISRHSSRTEARRPASRSDSTAFRSHPVPTGSTVTTVLTASAESSPETSQNSPTRARGCITVEPRTQGSAAASRVGKE